MTNGFFAVPNTFDLVSEPIHASTAIAMSKVLGVIVLKGFFCHLGLPYYLVFTLVVESNRRASRNLALFTVVGS